MAWSCRKTLAQAAENSLKSQRSGGVMREQDIRRIVKDVCEALDRRAKAAPIAVGVALAMGTGCAGTVTTVQADATATETTRTSSETSTQDSATPSDSGSPIDSSSPIDSEPMIVYGLAAADSTVPATDGDSASDSDAEADTWQIPRCVYMCSMAMYPEEDQDSNAPGKL
jgi:hypothetical protein